MGLNLQRESLSRWLTDFSDEGRASFLERLQQHIGQTIDPDRWSVEDDAYPRVGSYITYGIFRLCLKYLTEGDYEGELDPNDGVAMEALQEFRRQLEPASLSVPYVSHFLDSGDTDTIFIPVLFESPFEFDDVFVASLPAAQIALEQFAAGLGFNLEEPENVEVEVGRWSPVTTAMDVARVLYQFFTEKENACVALA